MLGLPCFDSGFDGVLVAHQSPGNPANNDHNDNPANAANDDLAGTDKEAQGDDWLSQVETLRALAHLVRDEDLSEIEVQRGDARISIKAVDDMAPGVAHPAALTGLPSEAHPPAVPVSGQAEAGSGDAPLEAAADGGAEDDADLVQVVSPMVGLFYRAPSPSDSPFVEVGDRVEVGQTLALVETMKVFNEITSEVEGTVIEISAQNGDLLETGDTLMVIRK